MSELSPPAISSSGISTTKAKGGAIGLVLLALLLLPAPLLPPHLLAETVQSMFGVSWKAAYFVAAVLLHTFFYGAIGVIVAFASPQASTSRGRLLRLVLVPLILLTGVVIVRSVRLGHVHVFSNALIPLAACLFGVVSGLLFIQHGWRAAACATVIALVGLAWAFLPSRSSLLSRATEAQLRRLVAKAPLLPVGDTRFGVLLQTAFAPMDGASPQVNSIEHNRAAILALGIAIGHERLARFVGLDHQADLVREAMALRQRTTLSGRDDWPRHFCLSAALTVLENPFASDASGLMKEQLDALAHGSGFSFTDLAADRAGVRFAEAATDSEPAATAMQARLRKGYEAADYFPRNCNLPENLTVEEFRRDYGGVGTLRYRQMMKEIETLLDRCTALSPSRSSQK